MSRELTGGCLCDRVQYRAEGPFSAASTCHCSQCSRWTGGVFSSVSAARDNLVITGSAHIKWHASSPEARRGFCGTCGSSLFWERIGSGRIAILLGTAASPTKMEIAEHIFVDDKSDYVRICDGKPQYGQDSTDAPAGGAAE